MKRERKKGRREHGGGRTGHRRWRVHRGGVQLFRSKNTFSTKRVSRLCWGHPPEGVWTWHPRGPSLVLLLLLLFLAVIINYTRALSGECTRNVFRTSSSWQSSEEISMVPRRLKRVFFLCLIHKKRTSCRFRWTRLNSINPNRWNALQELLDTSN